MKKQRLIQIQLLSIIPATVIVSPVIIYFIKSILNRYANLINTSLSDKMLAHLYVVLVLILVYVVVVAVRYIGSNILFLNKLRLNFVLIVQLGIVILSTILSFSKLLGKLKSLQTLQTTNSIKPLFISLIDVVTKISREFSFTFVLLHILIVLYLLSQRGSSDVNIR